MTRVVKRAIRDARGLPAVVIEEHADRTVEKYVTRNAEGLVVEVDERTLPVAVLTP